MILDISVQLDYALEGPTDILLQLEVAAGTDQRVLETGLDVGPVAHFARIDAEDGVGQRIWLRADDQFRCDYAARVEVIRPVHDIGELTQVPTYLLPAETVKYLMASRFCPADEFQSFVGAEFGELTGGARIAAMSDWIGKRFQYIPGTSDAHTTALDTFVQRKGICRDFAHMMITLSRASAIPARMASVYSTGIEPEDFHAVAEVYLDDDWHFVDPTGMASAATTARIGVGRDAADIAFMTSYGLVTLNAQSVHVVAADPAARSA